jgi:hypothetical protein
MMPRVPAFEHVPASLSQETIIAHIHHVFTQLSNFLEKSLCRNISRVEH